MSYVIKPDFALLIQSDNLAAVIRGNESVLSRAIQAAEVEVTSKLVQKYDITKEFTDTAIFNPMAQYLPGNRVYLDAPPYSAGANYTVGQLCLHEGAVYVCSTSVTVTENFNPTKWALVGIQYQIYYVSLPYPEFDYDTPYYKGDKVYWKSFVYTALQDNWTRSHAGRLQIGDIDSIPSTNTAPDSRDNSNFQYWGIKTAFIAPGTLDGVLLPSLYWAKGDNRNPQIVNAIVDIALYHAHAAVAPRNIPDLRVKRYDDTIAWLKDVAKGLTVTLALPKIQSPITQRTQIRFGGNVKRINDY